MEQDNILSLRMLFCGILIFCHCHLKQFNIEIQILLMKSWTVCRHHSPINLQGQTGCNCDLQPINYVCLVGITLQCSIVDCEKWTMEQRWSKKQL
jgi:hypothetical protein